MKIELGSTIYHKREKHSCILKNIILTYCRIDNKIVAMLDVETEDREILSPAKNFTIRETQE